MINKGKVIRIKPIKDINFFSKNKYLLVVCFVYIAGMVLSLVLFGKKGMGINWQGLFARIYLSRINLHFAKIFALSFIIYISALTLVFVLGTSITGIGSVLSVIFAIGYFMGGMTAYLYSNYSLKGVAFNALIVFLPSLLFILVLFFAAHRALEYSVYLSKVAVKRIPTGNNAVSFKTYSLSFVLLASVLLLTSVVDATLSKVFLKIFSF